MAPSAITEDYYLILEVEQTATPQLIVSSYRRLALKLHPDRNAKHDATEAFQLLALAYETLKDESKRREYDRIYPSLKRSRPGPQNAQAPRPPPVSKPQPEALSEAAQIAAIQKLKQERGARWWSKKSTFDSAIYELQTSIRQLELQIKSIDSVIAADAAAEARKNSWGTWLLTPIYKKAEESEEEKARKDRQRQERRIEKDMKERRLDAKKADLKKEEQLLKKAKEEVDAADLVDDRKIQVIQARISAKEEQERRERERVERERLAKIWKQQREEREKREKQEREAAEALRKKQAELRAAELKRQEAVRAAEQKRQEAIRAAEQKRQEELRAAERKRQEEETRKWQKSYDDAIKRSREQYTYLNLPEESTRQAWPSTCRHDGWWPKVQGRTACPECNEVWTYLLQCPDCKMKACPRCQASIRPRIPRNAARTHRRAPPQARPDPYYDDW